MIPGLVPTHQWVKLGPGASAGPLAGRSRTWVLWLLGPGIPELVLYCWWMALRPSRTWGWHRPAGWWAGSCPVRLRAVVVLGVVSVHWWGELRFSGFWCWCLLIGM